MEPMVVIVGVVTLVVVLWSIPIGRWSFVHRGHRIEVRNYAWNERIWVDGVARERTRTAGDHMTFADHAVMLPDATWLRVRIERHGLSGACHVVDGTQVVFDSRVPLVPAGDPRLAEAKTLLARIRDPEAAAVLERALRVTVAAERRARRTGARDVAQRSAAVDAALDCLRRGKDPSAIARARALAERARTVRR